MFAIALRYGAISGVVVIAVIIAGMVYADGVGGGHATSSLWFGYLIMILALSTIFLAIREYRNKNLGGVIKFLPAFGVGLLVAAIGGWSMSPPGKPSWPRRTIRSWRTIPPP